MFVGQKWLSSSVWPNFLPTKHNPDKLNAKLPDHAGSQSHAYIFERVINNKYAFYLIAYQKQLNKIQKLRIFQQHLHFQKSTNKVVMSSKIYLYFLVYFYSFIPDLKIFFSNHLITEQKDPAEQAMISENSYRWLF